ncbi:uroporphyrinogen-III C-methyltransferase [Chondrinema litorale]|uniref:uroporphyrinogen-III C-methyltransferase n=1 Tax=Chondrinema litorale TaxID=2994555 RepID=UPI002543B871|nr:uroporphyrinogen-III C-methyltransferase [Chondrinema litorale]UZR99527.1 uroporphyrinogen-III C-methyltransferase [Chondrinema litorale]
MSQKENLYPRVTLIGAGPGDPDLLTIKAMKALETADAILYDALVNDEILKYAPNAKKLFVGKRKGFHAFTQDEINQLIVEHALQYGHVVRLKGGDPFVFGRGKEEVNYVEAHGIEINVIPGITSAVAVPESVGIPVTHRKVAESFWVITATTAKHKLSEDIKLAAQSNATVVILMGMSKLPEIVSIYKANDKHKTAIAVIQNGTKENERFGLATIDSIEVVVAREKLSSPAIIVIGDVVKNSKHYWPFIENAIVQDEFIFQNLNLFN